MHLVKEPINGSLANKVLHNLGLHKFRT